MKNYNGVATTESVVVVKDPQEIKQFLDKFNDEITEYKVFPDYTGQYIVVVSVKVV